MSDLKKILYKYTKQLILYEIERIERGYLKNVPTRTKRIHQMVLQLENIDQKLRQPEVNVPLPNRTEENKRSNRRLSHFTSKMTVQNI